MGKWIDADALMAEFPHDEDWDYPVNTNSYVVEAINSAPSIDIVFCKVCKYKHINEDGETRYYYCALEDRPNRQWSVDDTDYCAWGEVRDE